MATRPHPYRPALVAHRGMPRRAPENTLASFQMALDAGCDGIELDVHGTVDGHVVVHHDPTLRLPSGDRSPPIAALSLDDIRRLGSPGPPAPTLPEVLDLVAECATLYVEVKAPGIEELVVRDLAAARGPVAVHSFDHRIVQRVRALEPQLETGVLMTSYLPDPALPLLASGARDLWQQWELIDEALVKRAHEEGGRVVAWTVNDRAVLERFVALGVDAICTDDVHWAREVMTQLP